MVKKSKKTQWSGPNPSVNYNGLTFDQLRKIWVKDPIQFFVFLKKNHPEGYRILCWNCNCSKGIHGYCPHEMELDL